jgi:hypothetical protein
MTDHFLVLFPKDSAWTPASLAPLADALKQCGFLGAERSPGLYGTGPEYLGLITYLGCSPQVALGESEAATAIRINGILDKPQFLQGGNLKPPRCPQCRKTLETVAGSQEVDEKLRCPHCGHEGLPNRFDWRRSAAFGRVFIEISNVFESEAVPSETLADCLQQATGEGWDYCYVRRELN